MLAEPVPFGASLLCKEPPKIPELVTKEPKEIATVVRKDWAEAVVVGESKFFGGLRQPSKGATDHERQPRPRPAELKNKSNTRAT